MTIRINSARQLPAHRLIAAVVLMAGGLFGTPAHAVTNAVVGTGTAASCTESAFATALAAGGQITFNCGGPATIVFTSVKTLTSNAAIDGGGVITLSGGLASAILYAAGPHQLSISNIALEKGYLTNDAGSAIRSAAPMTISNVTFRNNINTGCGGAVWTNSKLLVVDSSFESNVAEFGGGAICTGTFGTADLRIERSTFFNNRSLSTTLGYGGAIYVGDGSRVTMLDSAFFGNTAFDGGALYVRPGAQVALIGSPQSTIFATKMQFNANTARESGGAIMNLGGALTIDYALLTVNRVPSDSVLSSGGAIYNSGDMTFTNALVSRNEARNGGAVFVGVAPGTDHARASIQHVIFNRNAAGSVGGALYASAAPDTITTTVLISQSHFFNNTAAGGGGVARFNAGLSIWNSSFIANAALLTTFAADRQGGAIRILAGPTATSGPYVQLRNITLSGNETPTNRGGGIFNAGRVEIYGATIISNTNGVFTSNSGNTRFRGAVLQQVGSLNCDGDGTGSISDDSGNYSTDNSCALPNSVVGAAPPQLATAAFDGRSGTTYYAPSPGSPLINLGPGSCPVTDQIGATRVGACDIGAIEFSGARAQAYLPLLALSP
jgi:predicted outer membrane repeat protein